jgi:hypothetical protein
VGFSAWRPTRCSPDMAGMAAVDTEADMEAAWAVPSRRLLRPVS